MKKRVLLAEQHLRRGVDANASIAAHLGEMGIETRLTLTGAQLCSNLVRFEPHVVYYPWVAPYEYQFLRSRTTDVPIVNAYQEQNVALHSPEAQMVQWAGESDYLFAWGGAYKRKFEQIFSKPKVINTGNPRYDVYFDRSIADVLHPSRKCLSEKYDLDYDQEWVLFALDFPILFKARERKKSLIERGDLSSKRLELIRGTYEVLSTWMRRFAMESRDVTLIVRPHPGSDLDRIKQDFGGETDSVRYIRGGAIPSWIIACDRYVTRASTSIVEAWLANTEAALIQKNKAINNGQVRPHLREADQSLDSYSDFAEYIERGGRGGSRDGHHSFLSTRYRLDGKSALRTAQELRQIASEQRQKVMYSGGIAENMLEHAKFMMKKIINESGLNRWNPFDRPNDEFLSQDKAQKKIGLITSNIDTKIEK